MARVQAGTDLGERVRVLRKARGLTLQELGKRLGMTRSGISKWEQGDAQIPSATLPGLARALGVTVAELFGEDESSAYRARAESTVEAFRGLLALGPERVEINVYVRGEKSGGPSVEPAEAWIPMRADRVTKRVLEEWPSMSEEDRQEWIDFADKLRSEKDAQ